jgi:hypothetical protein
MTQAANRSDAPIAWWPLSVLASSTGLTRHTLIAACERGEIPIRLQRFGERGQWWANAADAAAYLRDARRPLMETQQ